MARMPVRARETPRSWKPWLYRIAGALVSIVFVYLAVRQTDLSEALRVLGTAQPALLAAGTLVYLSGIPARTQRWRLILSAQRELPWRKVLVPLTVGHMANNVLPARTGELYRAHFLGRRVRMSRSGVVGSIVVERTFDGLMLVGVILLVFALFPEEGLIGVAALLTGAFFVALALGLLLYGRTAERTHQGLDRGLRLLPHKLREFVWRRMGSFLHGIRGFLKTGRILEVSLYTVLIWTIEAGAIACVVLAFGLDIPPGAYLLVFALASLSTTLPSGPGYVGPYQYAFVLALGTFAVSSEAALAVSVAAQAVLLGSVTLIGLALLWREHLISGEDGPEPEKETG